MLKNIDKYDSTHFSYKDYKKKVHKGPNKDVVLFLSVFVVGVLVLLGFARILSPNVDVAVGNNDFFKDDSNENISTVIDERLKRIQMEDSGVSVEDKEMFTPELDQKIVLPKASQKQFSEDAITPEDNAAITKHEINKQNADEKKPAKTESERAPEPKPVKTEQITTAKVVVGFYATEKQAEVAKSIMQDSGIGGNPIVKNLGEYYSIQVGAYSSRDKAQHAANELIKNNFPARVIVE